MQFPPQLTEENIEDLVMQAVIASKGAVPKEWLERLCRWAEIALTDSVMIRLILAGKVSLEIGPSPDDYVYRLPTEEEATTYAKFIQDRAERMPGKRRTTP